MEVEPLETFFNVTVHEKWHGTTTQIRARVAPTSKAHQELTANIQRAPGINSEHLERTRN